jgi:hypothetical protein
MLERLAEDKHFSLSSALISYMEKSFDNIGTRLWRCTSLSLATANQVWTTPVVSNFDHPNVNAVFLPGVNFTKLFSLSLT